MLGFLDFETRSTVNLKKCGADVYARHPSTEVMCTGWAFDDDPAQLDRESVIDPRVLDHVACGGKLVIQNAPFELAIWNYVCVPKYGWPPLDPDQTICTLAMSYAMALPGALADVAPALGLGMNKDSDGHRVMLQLSQPKAGPDPKCDTCQGRGYHILGPGGGFKNGELQPGRTFGCFCVDWYTRESHPEKFEKLDAYCAQDVEVERALFRRLMHLSPRERELWMLDHRINQRGIMVAVPAAKAALKIVGIEKKLANDAIKAATDGVVSTIGSNMQLKEWLNARGMRCEGVSKSDVKDMLDSDPPPEIKRVLEIRKGASKSSLAKLTAMLLGICEDERLRGMFQFHGAGATGRYAGRRVQLQNVPRSQIPQADIEAIFEILESGRSPEEMRDLIELFYGPTLSMLVECLRGFLVAQPGCEFMSMDFSGIEARVTAWLAGDERELDIFRSGKDIYRHTAAPVFGVAPEDLTSEQRQIGKVAVLSLGFGGGVGAFQQMAKNYLVKVSNSMAESIKLKWRETHPLIVEYWKTLERAAMSAINNPGQKFRAGRIFYKKSGSFLWCMLPSGRVICYPYPKIEAVLTPWGEIRDQITAMTVESDTGNWVRDKVWYGKLIENAVQATARDLLTEAQFRLEAGGYPIVMHSHDENVAEIPVGFGSLEEMAAIQGDSPAWAAGLPVECKGWRGKRYRK
jgi:DNA polymerase